MLAPSQTSTLLARIVANEWASCYSMSMNRLTFLSNQDSTTRDRQQCRARQGDVDRADGKVLQIT